MTRTEGSQPGARLLLACVVAVVIGAAVAVAAGTVFDGAGRLTIGFWGLVDGVLAGGVGFGLTLVAGGVRWQRRIGAALLALLFGFIAVVTWWFTSWYGGLPVRSREGAWMYPLAIASSAAALLAIKRAVHPGSRKR